MRAELAAGAVSAAAGLLPPGALALSVAGETLWLLPSRALYWPAQRLLLVADLHLGKGTTLRRHGVNVPAGTGQATLQRLDAAVATTGASRLLVLGDLLHARQGKGPALDADIAAWRAGHPGLAWALLAGNHDRAAGVPAGWGLEAVEEGTRIGPFCLRHAPGAGHDGPASPAASLAQGDRPYVLCGHLHPAVRLHGHAGERARLPCFWFGAHTGVLPAFGALTGHLEVRPRAGDRVAVVAGDQVLLPAMR